MTCDRTQCCCGLGSTILALKSKSGLDQNAAEFLAKEVTYTAKGTNTSEHATIVSCFEDSVLMRSCRSRDHISFRVLQYRVADSCGGGSHRDCRVHLRHDAAGNNQSNSALGSAVAGRLRPSDAGCEYSSARSSLGLTACCHN